MTANTESRFLRILLIILHVLGSALCLFTLAHIWQQRVLLRLILERIPFLQLVSGHILSFILFSLVGAAAIGGIIGAFRWSRAQYHLDSTGDVSASLKIGMYSGMGCLVMCVFVLSTHDPFTGAFRLRHTMAAWICASIAFGLWCFLQTFRYRFSASTRHWCNLICLNTALALILAEITLRIAATVWASPLLVTESSSSQIRRDSERLKPGSVRLSFPVNSAGHYDTEFSPPSERSLPLVVTIGDSFSYGVVPHYYHYTTVAERLFPGAEVYNMGFPGTNPSDYLYHLVEEALPLEPDMVVIAVFVGNDLLTDAGAEEYAQWYDAQRYLVGVVWHRLQILRRSQSGDWAEPSSDSIEQDLVSLYPWLTDPMQESPSMDEEIYLSMEAASASLGAVDHPWLYERFFTKLEEIKRAAGNVRLSFMIIPAEFQINDKLWQEVVARNELPLQRDLPQQKIRAWAQLGDHEILDLLPLLLEEDPLDDGQRHLYHLRDTHFNARGNAVVGRALAKLIEANLAESNTPLQPKRELDISPRITMSGVEAGVVLQQFGALITDLRMDGSHVYDEALLGHSRDEIKSAVVQLLSESLSVERQNYVKKAAELLAFFQPAVGMIPIPIETIRADNSTWKSHVQAEMGEFRSELSHQN